MSRESWIHALKWGFDKSYPIIVAVVVTLLNAYIYSTGPFALSGAEISYEVENYYNMPDGSYMQPICVWNSGSKDIQNLDLSYYFESYIYENVLDKDFNITDRLVNASPQIGDNDVSKVSNNSREISYQLLKKGLYFREQLYINKPYPIKIISKNPDLDLKQVTTTCDPCSC